MNIQKVYVVILQNIRKLSSKVKPNVEVNEEVLNNIENGLFKPRKHPGIFKPKTINLPAEFVEAMTKALSDYPAKQILTDSIKLINYLKARHIPLERTEVIAKKAEIENEVLAGYGDLANLTEEEKINLKNKMEGKISKLFKLKLYSWRPVDYNIHTCLQYLLGRSPAEYAAIVRIFQEISSRDENFKPRSLFDFGSGVGTGTWAARLFWEKNLFEYFNVDSSVNMNDLALILLKGGTGVKDANVKGVFYRQFLPATRTTYDLVLCAYSLLELPSSRTRLETLLNLWNKTQSYLVIVEQGTNAGFKIINEARDFILDIKEENNRGHVFSPCPHDKICPRFLTNSIPCNFEIGYMTVPIGQNSTLKRERFCYVVLRKGNRKDDSDLWPRLVQPTLVRSKHTICRMCTAEGNLQEIIFTESKHGRITYRCARASEWGDMLPIKVKSN